MALGEETVFDRSAESGRRRRRLRLCALTAAVLLLSVAVAGAGVAAADGMTVVPDGPADHHPGDGGEGPGNASYALFGVSDTDIDYVDGFEIRWEDGVASKCYNNDLRTYGIDRGDSQEGEGIDEEAIQYTDRTSRTDDRVYVDFYPRNAFVGETTHLDTGDELVLGVENCVRNPAEPGWYRQTMVFNGTMEDGTYRETRLESNYVWVCECENEREAREQLGPPPSERDDAGSEATATPTPTPVATAEPTATETQTETPTATADSTPTADQTATADSTPTGEAADTGDTEPGDGGPATPVADDGSGFGVAVAVLAAALVGLLARRSR